MKLRSLTLENVRKFAGQRAEIRDIGDGISVISEANEFGKSTFFDALHALMFLRYGAAGREVQALRPAAGGAVRVRAEIEMPEGLFTLEKSFLSQKSASVSDSVGRVIAQQDEAERWIAERMQNGLDGPAGLLWVRQGVISMEPPEASAKDRTQLLSARRDLLSSVAGEIDMVTGGRRMDRVIRQAREALAELATATGRPKAGGPWAQALEEAEALETSRTRLKAEVAALRGALDRRGQASRRLDTLSDPEAQAARRAALQSAEAADKAARAHADRLSAARTQADLRRLELTQAQATLDGLITRAAAVTAAEAQLKTAQAEAEAARADVQTAQTEFDTRAGAHAAAAARTTALRQAQRQAQDAERRAQLVQALEGARKAVTAAGDQRSKAEDAQARLSPMTVTAEVLRRIETAQDTLRRARAARAGAAHFTLDYSGSARLLQNGAPVAAGTHPLTAPVALEMPGIGTLSVDPGPAAAGKDGVAEAEEALAAVLAAAGVPDVDAARRAAQARTEAAAEVTLAQQMFRALAPDGMEALQARVAAAETALEKLGPPQEGEPQDAEALWTALETEERTEKEAQAALDTARSTLDHERRRLTQAETRLEAADATRDKARADLGDGAAHDARLQEATRAVPLAEQALAEAEEEVTKLAADAPDLQTVAATLARAEGAVAQAQAEIQRLQEELSALGAEIRTRAEDGIEEALAETEGRHAAVAARAARFGAEVAALTLLIDTLEETRGAAQEAYFGPIQRELQPLLAILHDDAALSFDPATLLPAQMTRDGAEETLEQLSGGTREQIAVLTRLAFARLFAKAGKPMPVILDDALVYSDDDRIERMFTALHRVAQDQQVIVFTCRQRAFGGLGGMRPTVRVSTIA